jgi:hypothetical protein
MKHLSISIVLYIAFIIGFSIVTSAQAEENKPYVEVTLKSGEVMRFEYRSFMETNLPILPEKEPDSANEVKWFGTRRVIFVEKDTCENQNIGLENLREMEVIGIDINPCTKKKDWLFKVNLLAFDKYTGFFQPVDANIGKAQGEQGVTGQLLDRAETFTQQYEDIQTITFYPM